MYLNNEYANSLQSRMVEFQNGVIKLEQDNNLLRKNLKQLQQQNEAMRQQLIAAETLKKQWLLLQQEAVRKNNIVHGLEQRCLELENKQKDNSLLEAQADELVKKDAQIEKLMQKLEDIKENYVEKEKYKQLEHEFSSFQQRLKKEQLRSYDEGVEKTLKPLIEFFDTVQLIESAINNSDEISSIEQALKIMNKEFNGTLEKLSVAKINAVGDTFNPKFHDAIQTIQDEEKADNLVLKQWRCGYLHKDRLIRAATVAVNKK